MQSEFIQFKVEPVAGYDDIMEIAKSSLDHQVSCMHGGYNRIV